MHLEHFAALEAVMLLTFQLSDPQYVSYLALSLLLDFMGKSL